jgi:hypothetical protein
MRFFCFSALILTLVLNSTGCSKEKIIQITREDRFALNIGPQEDQIALYNLEGDQGMPHADIVMRDGLFYITDGNGEKIVRYNSYGDLLFMIYNEENNPAPVSLKPMQPEGVVTRWVYSYPFQEPGKLTVDSRKHIFASDKLPSERHSFDNTNRVFLDSIILHFDENGRFVEYLGQEGIGGTPFPRISGVYTSISDELVVVCRLPGGWNVYWFNSEGTVLYLIHLLNTSVPVPRDRENVITSVDSISIAPDSRKIYLKADYYRDTFDESTNTRTGNEPDSSVIWIISAENGAYTGFIEAPFFEYTFTENNRRVTEKMLYSLLGVIHDGRIFLYFPVEGGYSILILSPESPGSVQRQGFIKVDDDELLFNVFNLSGEGILSAILFGDWQAKIVWWRTDKLINGASSP